MSTIEERLWSRVEKTESGCWLWTGYTCDTGYGKINLGGKNGRIVYTHRLAYELFHGPIPDGHSVCHTCDVRNCINPSHLFAGTQQQNMDDMVSKGRHKNGWGDRTHCVNGHLFDADNTRIYSRGWRQCRECKNARRRKEGGYGPRKP